MSGKDHRDCKAGRDPVGDAVFERWPIFIFVDAYNFAR